MATNSYGKRVYTSPRENMAKKSTIQYQPELNTIVKIEFESINGKSFYGQATDDELLYIWVEVFKRKRDELFGVISTKTLNRNVRATFKLHAPVKLGELLKSDNGQFSYEKVLNDGSKEVVTARILGFGAIKPAELGELTKISVKTNFGVESAGVLAWLKLFGTVSNVYDFKTNPNTGLKTDVFETEILLKSHVYEYLPMFGQKVQIHYAGIPKMCNRCYVVGHIRKECNNRKKDWVQFIIQLVESEGFSQELIGDWTKAIARWKNANSNQA
jgi:hypothetical protein